MDFFYFLGLVDTIIGFLPEPPPVSFPGLPAFLCAALLRDTADFFCFLVILRALDAGTHFA